MNNIYFKKWLKDVGIRTIKTMAEAAIGVIGTDIAGIIDVDWPGVGSAVLLAGFMTILFNLSKIKVNEV